MQELTTNVNWLAVIIGAVAAFVVGWLWYSPLLFGKRWAAGNNLELGSAQDMPFGAMGAQALGLLLLSWFVGVTAVESKLSTFILALIAFCVLATSGGLFTKKPGDIIAIDMGYWIVAALIMFIVQGVL